MSSRIQLALNVNDIDESIATSFILLVFRTYAAAAAQARA